MLDHVLRAATYLVVFWAGFRSLDVAFDAAAAAPWTKVNASLAGLLPLGRKIAKVVLLALGLVSVLNELGFQVASLLAGLGIGGIALALAAQKTVENLFGSVAIGVDQPFRVGDFVKVEDVLGTVEAIGMRSTRVRTLDRTLVTFPNGKLADMKAETFAARDRFRLLVNLGLSYGDHRGAAPRGPRGARGGAPRAPADLAGRGERPAHRVPGLVPQRRGDGLAPDVRLERVHRASGRSCSCASWRIVEEAGTSLAFPTRTVHLVPRAAPRRA